MFKESSIEKLIEYIQSLPSKEQNAIVQTLVKAKSKRSTSKSESKITYAERVKRFSSFVEKHRLNVPENFKFNRDEAHLR